MPAECEQGNAGRAHLALQGVQMELLSAPSHSSQRGKQGEIQQGFHFLGEVQLGFNFLGEIQQEFHFLGRGHWIADVLCIPEGFCWQVGQVWPLPDISLEFKLILAFQNKRTLTPALFTFTVLTLRQDGCGTQCSALVDHSVFGQK